MPRHIIKIKDHYLLWSTVVDAPVGACHESKFDTLDRLYFYDREPSEADRSLFKELVERVKRQGTSHKCLVDVEEFIKFNRAGPGDKQLTLSEIYRVYCLKESIGGWSPRGRYSS